MAKPKQTESNTGAPATLDRLSRQELQLAKDCDDCRNAVEDAKRHLASLDSADSEIYIIAVENVKRLQEDYTEALERHRKLSSILINFDKSVDVARREGEKVTIEEAKELFQQYGLTYGLAIETYILSLSQDQVHCNTPQDFYKLHANKLRDCVWQAIETAKRNGSLPAWLL